MGVGDDMRFLYWDDLGDSQGEVDNQSEAEKRMMVIMQNGNSGEHYFNYYNEHPSAAEIWDDGEEQDVE
jgi:hypothetical protein